MNLGFTNHLGTMNQFLKTAWLGDMGKHSEDFLQKWLGWLFGIAAGSLLCSLFFGFIALDVFLLCAVIGYFVIRKSVKKNKLRTILL